MLIKFQSQPTFSVGRRKNSHVVVFTTPSLHPPLLVCVFRFKHVVCVLLARKMNYPLGLATRTHRINVGVVIHICRPDSEYHKLLAFYIIPS